MKAMLGTLTALALSAALVCAPAKADPLRIGVAAPLHGADAIFGNQLRLGVEQAIADINASGGFLGRKAKLVPGDDGSDPKKGVEIAKGFLKSGVDLIVGDFSSVVTIPASAVYAEAGVLDITPSAFAPAVTDRGLATVFRTCGRDDQQAGVAAKFLLDRHYAKIAILHDRTTAGKELADAVRKALADAGTDDVFYGSFAEGSRDLSGLLRRMRSAGTQIVFWGGGASGAALVARQLRDAKARIPLFGGVALASDDFATQAGPAADGTLSIFPQDPRNRPDAADLLRRLDAKDLDPGGYVFYAYAAIQVIRRASEKAQSLAPQALADAMHSGMTFQTVLGPIAFDAKGDPKVSDLTVYVWHKGPTGRMGFWDQAKS